MDQDKNHVKPTQEELDAQIRAAEEAVSEPQPEPEEEVIIPEPEIEPEIESEPEIEEAPIPEPEVKPEPDYKKKWIAEAKESQVIAFNKKEFETQIEEAQNMPEPTDDQVRAEFKDYDLLSEFEQQMAKEATHNRLIKRAIADISNKQKEATAKIGERIQEVEVFAIDPEILKKFPKLEGRQDEFKVFATKPTRLNLDLEDAAGLFSIALPEPTKHKGQMFEQGTGGANDKLKTKEDKISLDEARILMNTDYKKYKELLLAGKIEMDV